MTVLSKSQSPPLATVYLSLGSNLGKRQQQLERAVTLLRQHPAVASLRCSAVYETQPWPPAAEYAHYGLTGSAAAPPPEAFWNMCVKLQLDERALAAGTAAKERAARAQLWLQYCLQCESQLGRERGRQRWGPRCIDIDIIDYQLLQLESDQLTLPHPYFRQRLFVLIPLEEIAEDELQHFYRLRQRIQQLLALEVPAAGVTSQGQSPPWGHKIGPLIT